MPVRKALIGLLSFFFIVSCSHDEEKTIPYDPTEENRFTKVILSGDLNEPTEFAILPNKKILVVERKGDIKLFDPETSTIKVINTIPVYSGDEDGLMGVALDPNFKYNRRVYLYYSPEGSEAKQHLSRFIMKGDQLDFSTEVLMLVVPTQREECCHTGGSIQFGPDGLLYLSTGDDTNPFDSDGYSPADERVGRRAWDEQRTSGNTNDLRGKILRIRPENDGSYSIPEGNLFPVGMPNTRPEIYVMGNRNPYRISIDQRRNWLFWGEVGPDAGNNDEKRGPRGHDEINLAKQAGYFGWPLFVGNNKAYGKHNFATNTTGDFHDPLKPINTSPNNTGLRELPPAQPALIWYPYADSEEFPMMGKGGRNAMAGPVYYHDDYERAVSALPKEFDGKVFIYDWIRGWIFNMELTEQGDLVSLTPFMPNTNFSYMIDMELGPEGSLYILEYGTGWFTKNDDAAIVRIDYNPGNRTPTLEAQVSAINGGAPLTVDFTTEGTFDYDYDKLYYQWEINGERFKKEAISYTFEKPGIYYPKVIVRDKYGNKNSRQFKISVGNEVPNVMVSIEGNSSFYWPNESAEYVVVVSDEEDGSIGSGISENQVAFGIQYIKEGLDITEAAQKGHQIVSRGQRLISESDCQSCHKVNDKSIGPSYTMVAERYANDPLAVSKLSHKIINGGGGNWGEQAMAAHPSLSQEDAEEMVNYILSLVKEKGPENPLSGTYRFDGEPAANGIYVFNASYTDQGANGMEAITETNRIILKNPKVEAETFIDSKDARIFSIRGERNYVRNLYDQSFLKFEEVDFTNIQSLNIRFALGNEMAGGTLEIRVDKMDGELIGSTSFGDREILSVPVEAEGKHEYFFIFKNSEDPKTQMHGVDWIYFSKELSPNL